MIGQRCSSSAWLVLGALLLVILLVKPSLGAFSIAKVTVNEEKTEVQVRNDGDVSGPQVLETFLNGNTLGVVNKQIRDDSIQYSRDDLTVSDLPEPGNTKKFTVTPLEAGFTPEEKFAYYGPFAVIATIKAADAPDDQFSQGFGIRYRPIDDEDIDYHFTVEEEDIAKRKVPVFSSSKGVDTAKNMKVKIANKGRTPAMTRSAMHSISVTPLLYFSGDYRLSQTMEQSFSDSSEPLETVVDFVNSIGRHYWLEDGIFKSVRLRGLEQLLMDTAQDTSNTVVDGLEVPLADLRGPEDLPCGDTRSAVLVLIIDLFNETKDSNITNNFMSFPVMLEECDSSLSAVECSFCPDWSSNRPKVMMMRKEIWYESSPVMYEQRPEMEGPEMNGGFRFMEHEEAREMLQDAIAIQELSARAIALEKCGDGIDDGLELDSAAAEKVLANRVSKLLGILINETSEYDLQPDAEDERSFWNIFLRFFRALLLESQGEYGPAQEFSLRLIGMLARRFIEGRSMEDGGPYSGYGGHHFGNGGHYPGNGGHYSGDDNYFGSGHYSGDGHYFGSGHYSGDGHYFGSGHYSGYDENHYEGSSRRAIQDLFDDFNIPESRREKFLSEVFKSKGEGNDFPGEFNMFSTDAFEHVSAGHPFATDTLMGGNKEGEAEMIKKRSINQGRRVRQKRSNRRPQNGPRVKRQDYDTAEEPTDEPETMYHHDDDEYMSGPEAFANEFMSTLNSIVYGQEIMTQPPPLQMFFRRIFSRLQFGVDPEKMTELDFLDMETLLVLKELQQMLMEETHTQSCHPWIIADRKNALSSFYKYMSENEFRGPSYATPDRLSDLVDFMVSNVSKEVNETLDGDPICEAVLDFYVKLLQTVKNNSEMIIDIMKECAEMHMDPREMFLLFKSPGRKPSQEMRCNRMAGKYMAKMKTKDNPPQQSQFLDYTEMMNKESKNIWWTQEKGSVFSCERSSLNSAFYFDKIAVCSCSEECSGTGGFNERRGGAGDHGRRKKFNMDRGFGMRGGGHGGNMGVGKTEGNRGFDMHRSDDGSMGFGGTEGKRGFGMQGGNDGGNMEFGGTEGNRGFDMHGRNDGGNMEFGGTEGNRGFGTHGAKDGGNMEFGGTKGNRGSGMHGGNMEFGGTEGNGGFGMYGGDYNGNMGFGETEGNGGLDYHGGMEGFSNPFDDMKGSFDDPNKGFDIANPPEVFGNMEELFGNMDGGFDDGNMGIQFPEKQSLHTSQHAATRLDHHDNKRPIKK